MTNTPTNHHISENPKPLKTFVNMAIKQFITGFKTFVGLMVCLVVCTNLYTLIEYSRFNNYGEYDIIDWVFIFLFIMFILFISAIDAITTNENYLIEMDTESLSYLEKALPLLPESEFKAEVSAHIEQIYNNQH